MTRLEFVRRLDRGDSQAVPVPLSRLTLIADVRTTSAARTLEAFGELKPGGTRGQPYRLESQWCILRYPNTFSDNSDPERLTYPLPKVQDCSGSHVTPLRRVHRIDADLPLLPRLDASGFTNNVDGP